MPWRYICVLKGHAADNRMKSVPVIFISILFCIMGPDPTPIFDFYGIRIPSYSVPIGVLVCFLVDEAQILATIDAIIAESTVLLALDSTDRETARSHSGTDRSLT
jgi:hypothetical protein